MNTGIQREMTREEIDSFLESEWIGVLSLIDKDGIYSVPLPYFYDNTAMTINIMAGGRVLAIADNTETTFTVFRADRNKEIDWATVIANGKIAKVSHREELIFILDLMEEIISDILKKKAKDPEEAFRLYRAGILSAPESSNILKFKIANISGRFF